MLVCECTCVCCVVIVYDCACVSYVGIVRLVVGV